MTHDYHDLIMLFEQTFWATYRTKLVKGEDEPLYLPADSATPYARIIFAHGYYASALHEIAHWCVAGEKRREQEDFGYWYIADGRTQKQQDAFEQVEVVPQAHEWLISAAAQYHYNVSCDNLEGDIQPDRLAFLHKVHQQVIAYLHNGIPARTALFIDALRAFYHTPPLSASDFIIK